MKSFTWLLLFEIKNSLWRFSSLAYALLFGFLSFMLSIAFAGAFKGASVSFGLSNKLALNSPLTLNFLICLLGYIGLLVSAPIFGQSIYKDYEAKFNQILFATALGKRTYFSVRFIGSLISSLVILLSIGVGIWLATWMPFVDRTLIAENHLWFYVAPYLSNVIPNLFIFGGLFIAVVSASKKMAPVYVTSIAVFTGWLISQSLTSNLESKWLAAMIEPFGLEATSLLTRYWSISEQSTRVIPMTGVLLQNRLAWGTFGFFCTALAYWIFNPYELGREKKASRQEQSKGGMQKDRPLPFAFKLDLQPTSLKAFSYLAISEFLAAFKNIFFLMILLCGVLYLVVVGSQIGKMFGTETMPVTYQVLEVMGGTFNLFVIILITYFSGELVWRNRDLQIFEIMDSKPVPRHFQYFAKLFALASLQVFLSFIVLVCCVLLQTLKGYHHYEWTVYFDHLVTYGLAPKLLVCVLALFVQTMAPNKYVGHSILIFYYLITTWLPGLGYDHLIYLVGKIPRAQYSDMNGFGTSAYKFTILTVYWSCLYAFLALLTLLFWRRGAVVTFKDRWQERRDRLTMPYRFALPVTLIAFASMGAFVFYNTNILNPYRTKANKELEQVQYEKKFAAFQQKPQLEVVDVDLHADIFPETQSLKESGTFTLRNRQKVAVSELLVQTSKLSKIEQLDFDRPTTLTEYDALTETRIFHFTQPTEPLEEIHLKFAIAIKPRGFSNDEFSKIIVQNGTFIHNGDFTPVINYVRDREIAEDKVRRQYGLPERPRLFDVNDSKATQQTYISSEGTWIGFQATLSTSPDQIAVAPGYLDKEWTEGGRRYFHYKMDAPILNFYAILSARYELVRDEWNGVKIEVYHHPGHTWNIPSMINSVKKSLAYDSVQFSPYQFHQVRIFEFPRYETFAQAFPNTIPFSEAVGFIAKVDAKDPESIDYPFYVTAHEIAHQWWAHQVVSGPVQGATMLSESLDQYSAFLVQEKEYGPQQMKKFLKFELDRYLAGRGRETKRELPLDLNENQMYIHYEKGGLVFYALKDYFGEAWVNGILKDFLKDFAFHDGPFPRAVDLVARFKKAAPPEKRGLIDDLFSRVILYNNRAVSAVSVKSGEKYQVTLTVYSQKLQADELGHEVEVPVQDRMDIGIYGADGKFLYLEKHDIHSGTNLFTLLVNQPPAKAGIDPLNKLIDRVPDDNTISINKSSP
jgi:ABC-2 type transport system permease protein